MKKNSTAVLVVCLALLDGKGRVLMQQRREQAQHGGLWEFPGGKVEPGETLENALIREIEEELGIALDAGSLNARSFASSGAEPVVLLLYTSREWSGEPRCLDAQAIGWFTAGELAQLPMPPLDVPLAAVLREVLETAN